MSKVDIWGQQISGPTLGDEPNIEALLAVINALTERTVMRFATATARAASIPTPVHGMVTSLVAEDRIDRWDGTRWFPITPGPWHAVQFTENHQADSGSPGYRYVNGEVQFRGKSRRVSGGQYYTGGDWTPATMPSGWRPSTVTHRVVAVEMGAGIYYARMEIGTDGSIIVNTPPGASSSSVGLRWVAFDGLTYPLDTPPATL